MTHTGRKSTQMDIWNVKMCVTMLFYTKSNNTRKSWLKLSWIYACTVKINFIKIKINIILYPCLGHRELELTRYFWGLEILDNWSVYHLTMEAGKKLFYKMFPFYFIEFSYIFEMRSNYRKKWKCINWV